jgi:hypothetical protein
MVQNWLTSSVNECLRCPLPPFLLLPSSAAEGKRERGGAGNAHRGWEGVLPSPESFFQPFPCPVKWVSISQGLPLLCLRASDEAENRQALWNQYDSTGQVEGLKERSRMEGSPSTPPPCLSPEKPTRIRARSGVRAPDGNLNGHKECKPISLANCPIPWRVSEKP